MPQDPEYWFPAKRYGWGWGLPATWQGWTVLAAFLILVAGGKATANSPGEIAEQPRLPRRHLT